MLQTDLPADAFSRLDETEDSIFYKNDRFVNHLDKKALSTIEKIIEQIIVEKNPVILDLMSSWDSHIPSTLSPSELVGLGLNENELKENKSLTKYIIQNINRNPKLPFESNYFDAVLCTVSIDYLTNPFEVFNEVGKILKPGSPFLVIFSNRYFPKKVVKIWKESTEEARIILVKEFFGSSKYFNEPNVFVSRGKPRPEDDKYSDIEIYSDPVYVVYAEKIGGSKTIPRKIELTDYIHKFSLEEINERKKNTSETLKCPYCDEKLLKWEIPITPYNEWPSDYQYICFNDECPYYIRGWDSMAKQGNPGSYRLMFNPVTKSCYPVPVLNHNTLRDGIIK